MPYVYIGRRTDFKGKTVWEILANLKNFGVGRIIARNMFQRYPEPSYMKVLKVQALPPPTEENYDEKRKIIILCERYIRGIKSNQLVQMLRSTYKSDYFLVPKHKEEEFCKGKVTKTMRIFPREMEIPPLLREYHNRRMKAAGMEVIEEPKMTIQYNLSGLVKTYRVAEEGETPNVPEPTLGYGKTVAPRLFENLEKC